MQHTELSKIRKKICIVLDSNFLFVPLSLKIDLIDSLYTIVKRPFEIIILSDSIRELKTKLEKIKSPIKKKEILLAIEYAKNFKIVDYDVKENLSVDDKIIEFASKNNCIVATNDKEMRKKLKKLGIPMIGVRAKKYLSVYGY
ncbi:MAG: PIN domain-containing protein [Candidatus Asgardarchaeia archaeon]